MTMYEILKKETLAPNIVFMKFFAPKIANTAKPGQFVIIRADEKGERIPMGLSGWDEKEGTIDIVFYVLGTSTAKLSALEVGESVANIAGPLGTPTEVENFGRVICACGWTCTVTVPAVIPGMPGEVAVSVVVQGSVADPP